MVDISVITVTYNNEKTLGSYIDSLKKFLPKSSEIIIVDNNSIDKTTDYLEKNKEITLIKSTENLGFSKANNLGVKSSSGKNVLFLNPDASLKNDFTEALSFFEKNPDIGILAPKIIEESGETQKSVRKLPTVLGALKEYYFKIKNEYEAYVPENKEPLVVESAVAACIIMRKEVFQKLGGFDEKFFMYFEDLDLCRRIRAKGYEVVYFPSWIVSHNVGFSFNKNKALWLKESARKYHGLLKYIVLYLLLRLRPKNGSF